jgi:hypothetical protein
LLVGLNPASTVTVGHDESCAWDVSRFVEDFINWRQPIIRSIYGCPSASINPELFNFTSAAWSCF